MTNPTKICWKLASLAAWLLVTPAPALFAAPPESGRRGSGKRSATGFRQTPARISIDPLRSPVSEPARRETPASPRPPADGARPIRSFRPARALRLPPSSCSSTERPSTTTSRSSRTFPPPDANGAAGPDHYFQAINLVFRVFDKSGATRARPPSELQSLVGSRRSLRDGSPNTPLVKYDVMAGRWFVSQIGFDSSDGTSTSASRCRPRAIRPERTTSTTSPSTRAPSARARGSGSGPRRTT